MKKNTIKITLIIVIICLCNYQKIEYKLDDINSKTEYINWISGVKSKNKTNYLKKKNIKRLYVPKVKLNKKIIEKKSKNNNVNKNIKTIKYESPARSKSLIILAAHSGTSKVSFFKNISKLKLNDKAYVIDKRKYEYKLIKKYETKKNGKIKLNDEKKAILVLTTCSTKHKNKQLVLIFERNILYNSIK